MWNWYELGLYFEFEVWNWFGIWGFGLSVVGIILWCIECLGDDDGWMDVGVFGVVEGFYVIF